MKDITDLKKLKKLDLQLPKDFELSVWKSIDTRMPRGSMPGATSWGDILWTQPAWLGGLVCAVLLTGMALGQFHANTANSDASQRMTDIYVDNLNQGESI